MFDNLFVVTFTLYFNIENVQKSSQKRFDKINVSIFINVSRHLNQSEAKQLSVTKKLHKEYKNST